MTKLVVVYDDSIKVEGRVKTILGNKSFGDMVLKRRTMFTRLKSKCGGCCTGRFCCIIGEDCIHEE